MSEIETTTESGPQPHRCFAGSNTPMLTEALAGRPLLVSYADIRSRPTWWRETLRPMLEARAFPFTILDSGAFTVASQGIEIDIDAYAAFAREHLELFDVTVNLDSIAGDVDESRRNLETLRRAGVPAIPVFHEGEPWSELETMIADTGYIGLGFARVSGRLKNPARERRAWLEEAFARVGDRAKIHGFAMTRLADELPFYSVDSTTWIAEYRGLRNRTPGARSPKTHGVGGELGARLADWSLAELTALAVASYNRPSREARAVEDAEKYSRGQARTVFRRYGRHLEAAVRAIEEARYAEAA